ncbi:glycosidase [Paenibacillus rhizovicinus]|uniref:Glycosidase n=1 Tax=Paenibacillus rhizovicinus TaxID=2704463 RepID=A0A6C0P680_9BACL|nr:glycosidase [Paenibacillus rhizovicinus]QHW33945.1 glycosidase [Paenibacillus rhizovicinus]
MKITRCESNPIVTPGLYDWRKATVFNPAVIIENDKFYMIERTAGSLDPFQCFFGLLESEDGVNFRHVLDKPVIHPEQFGFPYGSIQDPRVVKIDDTFYMNYALRPCSMSYYPTGVGIPNNAKPEYPNGWGKPEDWLTRSSIATSKDLINWEFLCDTTPLEINDRDNILFPEKIGGRYALLRRPEEYIGEAYGTEKPAMWISYSDNLIDWDAPILLAVPEADWEYKKIGGSTPPIKTDKGWLTLYHGVGEDHVYRVGAMLLDLEHPEKIVARAPGFIMEPETYYEKFGLFIPNVVFPTANVVKDGLLYIYYGCTDTAICLATVPLDELVDYIIAESEGK